MNEQNTETVIDEDRAKICHLKWFNTSKGFGFVVPEGTRDDVFLHASILQKGGYPIIGEGALLSCIVEKSENGYFAKEVIEVIEAGKCPFATSEEDTSALQDKTSVRGLVKWYDDKKEFGFVIPEDGVKDIFIHKSCLEASGIETLIPGQAVVVTFKPVLKGREALSIKVIENP